MYKELIKFRKQNNLTCQDMADLLGVTKATYSKKENCKIKFSLEEAKIISKQLKVTIEKIFN